MEPLVEILEDNGKNKGKSKALHLMARKERGKEKVMSPWPKHGSPTQCLNFTTSWHYKWRINTLAQSPLQFILSLDQSSITLLSASSWWCYTWQLCMAREHFSCITVLNSPWSHGKNCIRWCSYFCLYKKYLWKYRKSKPYYLRPCFHYFCCFFLIF